MADKQEKDPQKVAAAKARANTLSDDRRKEIAQNAAAARWGLKATHKGNFKEEFGIDVECFVLNDAQKTAVISQRGMGETLGLGSGGSRLPRFVAGKTMSKYLGPELREKLGNPLIFQGPPVGQNSPPRQLNGYDVTILIDLCKAVVTAESDGALLTSQGNIAKQAHVILSASAKAGIKGLVYALSGYDQSKEEVIAAFKVYIQEEARKYEPEFPNELYTQWHRLYELPIPVRGKPWQFKYLTVNHIYYPLAKSSGKILSLLRALKSKEGDRQKKLFQFLNEIGARALRMHLGRVLEMAESSYTSHEYERRIIERFGGQHELDLISPAARLPAPQGT